MTNGWDHLPALLIRTFSVVADGKFKHRENSLTARLWWLTPVILATQEVVIRRIMVRS
jgi:hypothetical protein